MYTFLNMFGGVHPVEPESVVTRSDYQFIAIYRKALGPLVAKSTVSCGFPLKPIQQPHQPRRHQIIKQCGTKYFELCQLLLFHKVAQKKRTGWWLALYHPQWVTRIGLSELGLLGSLFQLNSWDGFCWRPSFSPNWILQICISGSNPWSGCQEHGLSLHLSFWMGGKSLCWMLQPQKKTMRLPHFSWWNMVKSNPDGWFNRIKPRCFCCLTPLYTRTDLDHVAARSR